MQSIRLGDVRLAYEEEGRGDPLLLLHGFPLGRWIWDAQRRALAARWRVITPDLRGQGDSEVTDGPYDMGLLADDVMRLCDALGLDRVVLGGLSLGGYVAFEIWRRYPARVRALLLCDTRAKPDDRGERVIRQSSAETALKKGTEAVVAAMLPKLLGRTTLSTRPELCDAVRARLVATDPRGVAATLLGMMDRPDSTPTLPTITVPTLIVVGTEDALTGPAVAREMAEAIPNARIAEIDQAGHLTPVEQPEATTAAFQRLLGDTQPPANGSGSRVF
ncbi:MAG TPA: alpha/beta fold hydrolase [Polyangia bacterium]|jgi:pimeloyl-ACP methyl ester carboxylesterase